MVRLGLQKRKNKSAVIIWAGIGKVVVVPNCTIFTVPRVILILERKKIDILA